MAEQKAKSISKKVVVPKLKAKTSVTASVNKKSATEVEPAISKKVAAKKNVPRVAEAKQAKPAVVKKTPAPAADTKVAAKKPAAAKTKLTAADKKVGAKPSPEERYRMVQLAAYYIAEKHGFQGRPDWHWVVAEREIAKKLDK
jgi:hypothetical protein